MRKTKKDLMRELVDATRANQVATDKMDEAGGLALGVNRTDGRCLDLIDQAGRISAGELAAQAGLTSGAMTAVLDRLEKKGYVRRVADPTDRRRVMLEATDEMRRRGWDLWGPISERAMPVLEKLTTSEIELLIRFMRLGTELNETRAAEIRADLDS
ncbi:MAG TPA: MarR family transcriptional regulator [Solirubrobacterales bacterium]|jgi:DNA-binding MarR family transcriptional regulator|nr:MarR family transcriptional regulator [Solirubrobacterales bacterium]